MGRHTAPIPVIPAGSHRPVTDPRLLDDAAGSPAPPAPRPEPLRPAVLDEGSDDEGLDESRGGPSPRSARLVRSAQLRVEGDARALRDTADRRRSARRRAAAAGLSVALLAAVVLLALLLR